MTEPGFLAHAIELAAEVAGIGDSREWWFFRRLAEMDLITVYPALLYLFGLGDELPTEKRRRALVALESFLVRRLIARDSTRSYGSLFTEVLVARQWHGTTLRCVPPV